jgi:hypothetical protein
VTVVLARRAAGGPPKAEPAADALGHADVAFTMKQYAQTDLEADRRVANTFAELIVGGALISTEITDKVGQRSRAWRWRER